MLPLEEVLGLCLEAEVEGSHPLRVLLGQVPHHALVLFPGKIVFLHSVKFYYFKGFKSLILFFFLHREVLEKAQKGHVDKSPRGFYGDKNCLLFALRLRTGVNLPLFKDAEILWQGVHFN